MDVDLSPFQLEFMSRSDEPLLILSAGVGSGKSYVGSWAVAQYFIEGKRILLGAQTYRALTRVMATEVMKRLDELEVDYEYHKADMEIHGAGGAVIYLYTAENPTGILGLSDIDVLCLDEAGYAAVEAYNWARDRQRGPRIDKAIVRLFSSPDNFNAAHSWFPDLIESHPESVIYGSSLENPFTSDDYKQKLLERYPPGTPLYEQQILGRILRQDARNVILRQQELPECESPLLDESAVYMGVDFAGNGADATTVLVRNGRRILDVQKNYDGSVDSDNTLIMKMWRQWKPRGSALDATGGWARGFEITGKQIGAVFANFGDADDEDDSFLNLRAGMYMRFRGRVLRGFYIDPKYKDLRKQIRATTYRISEGGKLAITSKEKIREALGGASPDDLDALVLSFEAERKCTSVPVANGADYYRNLVNSIR